ncbi:DUF1800 domain-containing protein [Qipengyuania sp. ASV99]|uniref:DUF1800 domain-containing protein n=1 Tax=Qipengyuania sp. ASV99 TaxID=3399681 RepID=UPI003A4C5F7B
MSKPSIALNRFGYGLRRGQIVPGDPVRSLYAQMDAFDPAPAILADREDTSAKAGEILEMLRSLRRERQSQAAGTMNEQAMEPQMQGGADPLNGLPPDVRQSYQTAARTLREDAGLRTRIAITSTAPMMERLVHFWSNHFSVSAKKPGTHFQVANHEFSAIRPHVLGNFSDLLKAAVLHPAMLLYLDQFQSVGPNSPFQQRRAQRRRQGNGGGPRGLNENLAREILELHTLGVDGGYDQADVTEFARALTGWTIGGLARIERFSEPQPGGAAFAEFAHEPGSRQVLGRTYREGGAGQALAVLDDLASHPSTARFIATKLARHFAGDTPPQSLVARLEAEFRRSNGDLASLTRTLINSPEVWTESPVKFRQPFEWLVAVLRITGIESLSNRRLSGALSEIGQMPWLAPSPAGYDDLEGSWAGPDALLRRVEMAERIARGAPSDDVMARAGAAFPGALTDHTRTWLARAESGTQALALLLVSPEMMRR